MRCYPDRRGKQIVCFSRKCDVCMFVQSTRVSHIRLRCVLRLACLRLSVMNFARLWHCSPQSTRVLDLALLNVAKDCTGSAVALIWAIDVEEVLRCSKHDTTSPIYVGTLALSLPYSIVPVFYEDWVIESAQGRGITRISAHLHDVQIALKVHV